MNPRGISTILLTLLAVSITGANEPVKGECSAIGSEGFYYLVDPLPDLDPNTVFELAEHPSGSKELIGHAVLPPLPGQPHSNIRQLEFEHVSLDHCELRFSVQFPDGTALEFDGKFVMANPFLVEHPPNPIVLAGRFSITTVDRVLKSYERALFYDSGY